VDRLEEMLRFQEVRNPVERLVVDENGAEQGLLRLDIVRGGPECRRGVVDRFAECRISRCPGGRV
jgi:hypothetical protein